MNAVIKDTESQTPQPIDESKLPISQVSKEERERRRIKLENTMDKVSNEAREKGLTDEILEELLKDI